MRKNRLDHALAAIDRAALLPDDCRSSSESDSPILPLIEMTTCPFEQDCRRSSLDSDSLIGTSSLSMIFDRSTVVTADRMNITVTST